MKTMTRADLENPAKVVADCGFDDWAAEAKTALAVADSAPGLSGRTFVGQVTQLQLAAVMGRETIGTTIALLLNLGE
jgi:hypothetical protein